MTAQAREIIYINGKEEQMATEPLEPFLKKHPHLRFEPPHTACWRGYFGTWELKDDKLYLLDFNGNLEGFEGESVPIDLADLFPGRKKVFADWFSGKLEIERGELLDYDPIGSYKKYEQSLFLIFENGLKTHEFIIDRTEFPF